MTSGVYLIHFSEPYKHARHYVGYADDIQRRFREHKKGQGARLCEVVVEAGIKLHLVRTWPGADREFERKLHSRGKSIFCPLCNEAHWFKNMPQPKAKDDLSNDVDFWSK